MFRRLPLVVLALVLAQCASKPPPPPPLEIDFRAELSPFGEWIVVAPYGRLWHPNPRVVGEHFVPYYSGGQWQLSNKGWSFKSKWSWGDFVFHYGRWVYVQDLDWLWSLDTTQGLAWVQWKASDLYVGWSPIPPVVRAGPPPELKWTFVRARYFAQPEIDRFPLNHDEATRAPNETQSAPANGPLVQTVMNEGGLTGDAKTGFHVPELPVPTVEVAAPVAAPTSKVEVEMATPPEKPAAEQPAPKKTKAKKKKK
jgi:hypothetical protein